MAADKLEWSRRNLVWGEKSILNLVGIEIKVHERHSTRILDMLARYPCLFFNE